MNKMREDIIKEFTDALEQDTIPWRKKWTVPRPCNAVSGHHYRGANAFWLMYMQEKMGYEDNRWCTYKQAQEKGWQVRAGEKGTRVEFWSWYDTEKKKRLDWMDMENLRNKLEPGEFEKRVKPMVRVSVVFNGKQIDGIPEQTITHNVLDEETLTAQRAALLNNMALRLYEGGGRAYYEPDTDTIHMPGISQFENEYVYMSTFLHEAGHATGHESRLDRGIKNSFGTPDYAREELRAEIASAFTAQILGLPGEETSFDNHKAYIQDWIKVLKKEPNELFRAIKDAEKISDYLIEKGEFKKILEKKAGVAAYAGQGFNAHQMEEIRKGLEAGVDVSIYAMTQFDSMQMEIIRLGLEQELDVSVYASPDFSWDQMIEIEKGLKAGVDASIYADPQYFPSQMGEIRKGLEAGLDVDIYADPQYHHAQMVQIRGGLEEGLDVSSYADPKYNFMEMQEIRERLRQSLISERKLQENTFPGETRKTEEEKTGGAGTPEDNFPTPGPNAEPTVTILWSEHSRFHDGETMGLSEANALIESLDRATISEDGYYKTKFRIDFVMDGQPDNYIGRQDLGDGDGTLIEHIESYHASYGNNEDWDNYVLQNGGEEALETDKAQRAMLLDEFIPYLKLHNTLSQMEQAAAKALEENSGMTATETAYHTAMQAYVSECRGLVNQGEYNLPPVPQLKDFDREPDKAYREHVMEEIAQEAAAAGMTVEEYAANGYEPYAAELPGPPGTARDMQEYSAEGQAAPERKTVYYTINEESARRANDENSFSDYRPGSATAEYRQMVDKAVEIAEQQKKRTDPMYHEKIDSLVDTYARKLAENMNSRFSIEARVPSVLIAGGSNFPVQKKEKQNAARDRNMGEWNHIQGLLDKIRSTGMGGISADDPNAVSKLETKLEKLEALQETMKAVNAYYRKHKTLDGCPHLSPEQIEKMKASMSGSWRGNPKPFESYELSNNNAEIHRLKDRITALTRRKELGYVGWEFDGGHVKANTADNRLQVFFDEKPDKEIREDLKGNGFRWSPKAGAWQRQLNDNAIYAADRLSCIQPLTGELPTGLQKRARQEAAGQDGKKTTGREIAGEISFSANGVTGDVIQYTDPQEYLKAVEEEIEYRASSGFQYHTFTNDPEIRKGIDDIVYNMYGEENPHDMDFYRMIYNPEFNEKQNGQIAQGLRDNLDVRSYADPKLKAEQMEQIRLGLQSGIDVTVYANPEFGFLQMSEIRKGLEAGVDVSSYLNPDLNALQMGEIRKELEWKQKIAPGKIDHSLLDEVARMELDLRVPAEERLARWSGDYSTFEPVKEGLTNQELQEHLEILRRKQIPTQEEIYQSMPEEKKQLYDMNMDYGDWKAAERLAEEQRQKLQEEENKTQQRQERSVAAHGKIR